MTWLDYAVLGVLGVSIVWGLWRGLVREVISIIGWVAAFLVANLIAGPLGLRLPHSIPTPQLRLLVAFVVVFVVTLAIATIVGMLLSKLIKAAGLGGLDRALGAVFGTARGLLVVLAAALLAGLTGAPRQPFWRDSVTGLPLSELVLALRPWLPKTFAEQLRYD